MSGGRAARLTVIPHHCAPRGEAVTLLKGAERQRFLAYLQRLCAIVPDEDEVARIFDAWCARWIRSGGLAGLAQPPRQICGLCRRPLKLRIAHPPTAVRHRASAAVGSVWHPMMVALI
mgnify:CR=1 FL=1